RLAYLKLMMTSRRFRGTAFWLVCLNLTIIPFQNCSPIHSAMTSQQENLFSSGGYGDSELTEKFTTTLHPVLKTNCGVCHGDFQVPKFAVDDPAEAFTAVKAFNLADLSNPGNSYFLVKIRSGHNGFTESLAQEVLAGVEAWVGALEGVSPPPPPPPPVDTVSP